MSPPPGFDPRTVQSIAILASVDTLVNLTVPRDILLGNLIGDRIITNILLRVLAYQTFKVDEDFVISN